MPVGATAFGRDKTAAVRVFQFHQNRFGFDGRQCVEKVSHVETNRNLVKIEIGLEFFDCFLVLGIVSNYLERIA